MRKALVLGIAAAAIFAAQKKPSAASGAAMYRSYCASCHGVKGKGDGPAARALKDELADLGTLARRNGGAFPAVRVFQIVEGDANIAAHGSRDMPVWGAAFRRMDPGNEAAVKLRVRNLVRYIESLQVK